MLNNFRKTFVLVAVVAGLSTGCNRTQYQKLTEAGNKYTIAVDTLLVKASELQINSSSEKLLLDDRLSNQTLKDYEDYKKQDQEIIETISDIREHNQLLRRYFATLRKLSNSDAPDETKKEIDNIANNLENIGLKLQKNTLFTPSISLGNIGKLIVHSKINRVLKEELEKRNPIILKELTIQQEMLKGLSEFMKHRVELMKQTREQLFIIAPLREKETIPYELLPQWIQARKGMFLMEKHITELENASHALNDFKEIYKASVEGKVKSQSIDDALKDIDYFLALLENN